MSVATFDTLKTARDLAEAGFGADQAEALATAMRNAVSESAVTGADMARQESRFDRLDERVARVEERLDRVEERLARVEERLARVEERLDSTATKADVYRALMFQTGAIVAVLAALNLLQ